MGSVLSPAEVADLTALNEALGMPDAYRLKRPGPPVPDGQGGSTRPLQTVEAGMCLLKKGTTRPEERLIADRMGWTVPYAVSLPLATTATPRDTLEINGRTFEVGGVVRAEYYATNVTAVCEERG